MSIDRRTFLKLGGTGILGVSFVSLLNGCENFSVTPVGDGTRIAPYLTPVEQFFVQNGGEGSIVGWTRPTLTEADWKLEITEDVAGTPQVRKTIRFADLVALQSKEISVLKTIQCVLESPLRVTPTGYMGNTYWTGIPLSAILEGVTFDPGTKRLRIFGYDGFTNNITIDRLNNKGTDGLLEPLIVYKMEDKPLTPEHGFPVRLIMQEGLGYKCVKWLKEIRATTADTRFGTYQTQKFVDDGIMRVNSRATNISDNVTIPAGPIEITGYAVSGEGTITNVEVAIDGVFQQAERVLLDEIQESTSLPATIKQIKDNLPYPYLGVWVKWRILWEAPRGDHRISIRATDSAGKTQPDVDNDIFDGQTGVTTYNVTVE